MRELAKYCDLGEKKQGTIAATQLGAESGPRRSNHMLNSKRGIGFMEPVVSRTNK